METYLVYLCVFVCQLLALVIYYYDKNYYDKKISQINEKSAKREYEINKKYYEDVIKIYEQEYKLYKDLIALNRSKYRSKI